MTYNQFNSTERESSDVSLADKSIEGLRQPFDATQPELSTAEQMEAASLFKDAANDALLTAMAAGDTVSHKAGSLYPGSSPVTSATLRTAFGDGSSIAFYAISTGTDTNEHSIPLEVSFQVMDGVFGRESSRYELSRDGDTVTRHDMGDMYGKMQKQRSMGRVGLSSSNSGKDEKQELKEMIEETKNNISQLKNEMKNQELARQMGYNDQPVGPEEIRSLAELLKHAQVYRIVGARYDGDSK